MTVHGLARYLNHDQAAESLGIKPITLYQWRTKGQGPPFFKIGKRIWYDPDDVDRWIRTQRNGSDAA